MENKIYMRNKETQDFLEVKITWKIQKAMMIMNLWLKNSRIMKEAQLIKKGLLKMKE
jgi:hypothetical protein